MRWRRLLESSQFTVLEMSSAKFGPTSAFKTYYIIFFLLKNNVHRNIAYNLLPPARRLSFPLSRRALFGLYMQRSQP